MASPCSQSGQLAVVHLGVNADDQSSAPTHAAVTDAVVYGTGTVVERGYITRADNDALAALNLPWEQVAVILPDQRVTDRFPASRCLVPATARDGAPTMSARYLALLPTLEALHSPAHRDQTIAPNPPSQAR